MTYGAMKDRILALLDLDGGEAGMAGALAETVLSALPYTMNATAHKAALHLRPILKSAALSFVKGAVGLTGEMPSDGFDILHVEKDGRLYGAETFMLIGRSIILFEKTEGVYTVSYYAFPEDVTVDTDVQAVLPYDAVMADAVAYGTAGELSHLVYPTDMTRYMRLMTEYDERVTASVSRTGDTAVKNTLFRRRRGV